MLFKKLKISFYTCCLSIILMIVPINAIDVLIGGESVGIILNYDGVCITGFYKIKVDNEIIDPSNYFEINDIITSVDKKNVKTIDDLTNIIKNCIAIVKNNKKNAYESNIVYLQNRSDFINVKWKSYNTLLIEYKEDGDSDIIINKTLYKNINIEYKKQG